MPAPRFPLSRSRAPRRTEKGALGLFQLLGLGLLLLFVVFLLIVVARSLFASP